MISSTWMDQEIPEGFRRSRAAFLRDLGDLMRLQKRKWWRNIRFAAYHGEERVAVGDRQTKLYQLCLRRGMKEMEFYVGWIGPQSIEEIEEVEPGGNWFDEIIIDP